MYQEKVQQHEERRELEHVHAQIRLHMACVCAFAQCGIVAFVAPRSALPTCFFLILSQRVGRHC